jgi:hypothetical protein
MSFRAIFKRANRAYDRNAILPDTGAKMDVLDA